MKKIMKRICIPFLIVCVVSFCVGNAFAKYQAELEVGFFSFSIAVSGATTQEELKAAAKEKWNNEEPVALVISGGEWSGDTLCENDLADCTYSVEFFGNTITFAVQAESITINDGVFTDGLRIDEATVTVYGGSFDIFAFWGDNATLLIRGGVWASDSVTFAGDAFPKIEISGGSFRWNPSAYLAEGYEAVLSDGMYTVQLIG